MIDDEKYSIAWNTKENCADFNERFCAYCRVGRMYRCAGHARRSGRNRDGGSDSRTGGNRRAATETTEDEGLSFSLTTLTDETIDDSIISENKLTMVNFWATWCGPCVSEIPDLQLISEEYADKRLCAHRCLVWR